VPQNVRVRLLRMVVLLNLPQTVVESQFACVVVLQLLQDYVLTVR
jgi:hypothetical protein